MIPKIIHQTWKTNKFDYWIFKKSQASVLEHLAEWQYKFFTIFINLVCIKLMNRTWLLVSYWIAVSSGYAEESFFPIPKVPVLLSIQSEFRGQKFYYLIDTGSSETYFDTNATQLYGSFIKPLPTETVRDSQIVRIHEAVSLKLGQYQMPLSPVGVISLDGLQKATGLNINAIIGVRSLRFSRLLVSNSIGQLNFASIDQIAKISGWKASPLVKPIDVVETILPLETQKLKFLIDTGDNGSISLEHKIFQHLVDMEVIKTIDDGVSIGFDFHGNKSANKRGTFKKGEFMGSQLVGYSVYSSDMNSIGLKWLFQFDYMFDFPASEFRFNLKDSHENPIDLAPFLGAVLKFDIETHEAVIDSISEDGPLAKAGITKGDKILKFGSLQGEDLTMVKLAEHIQVLQTENIAVTVRNKKDDKVREQKVLFTYMPRIKLMHNK